MKSVFVALLLLATISGICTAFRDTDDIEGDFDYNTPDITPGERPEPQFQFEPNDFEEIAIQISTIAKYITNSEQHFQFFSNENEIFVLGMPKSGKSTLIDFLTQDNSKLVATKHKSGNLYIKSTLNNISPNNEIYPILFNDDKNHSFVEIPSLKYSTYYPNDFAAGYFNKKTIEATKHPKFILLIPFSSNMFSENNTDISNLIIHTASMLRSILRFTKSFAVVVTKVPRVIRLKNEILTDEQFKAKLAQYLISLRTRVDTSVFFRNTIWKTRKVIEYITKTQNIILFKTPSKEGPLNQDSVLQSEKQVLLDTIHEHLKYALINPRCIKYIAYTDYSTINNQDFGRDRHLYYSRYFATFMEAGYFIKSMFSFFKIGMN